VAAPFADGRSGGGAEERLGRPREGRRTALLEAVSWVLGPVGCCCWRRSCRGWWRVGGVCSCCWQRWLALLLSAAAAALGGGDEAPAGMGSGCAEGKKIDEEGDEAVNLFGLGLLAEGDDEEDRLKWLVSGWKKGR